MPRIVIQAGPPFLVVHTNAAYSRLSGIDSHTVVGKTISSLLSMPEAGTLPLNTRADSIASPNGNVGPQAQEPLDAVPQQVTNTV